MWPKCWSKRCWGAAPWCVLLLLLLRWSREGEATKEAKKVVASVTVKKASRCEEISIPMCKGIGYNYTSMPNQFNHEKQDEAGLEVHQFWPLVEMMCSPDLKFFLCSVYAPICIEDYDKPLPACRSVCERAKSGCAPIMYQYGFEWPKRMNCSKLPRFGDQNHLCMDERNGTEPEFKLKKPNNINEKCRGKNSPYCPKQEDKCRCDCQDSLMPLDHSYSVFGPYKNESFSVGNTANCALPCHSAFLTDDEKSFAHIWITMVAILCCISTLTTLTTFLIDIVVA